MSTHNERIRDQFTRQAIPFGTASTMSNEAMLQRLVEFSQASATDTMLDVASGPGLLLAAFAPTVKHATGIDLVPAMIEQAKRHCAAKGVSNVTFDQGDVTAMPYPDASFSLVTSRFAFHHFEQPDVVLREMVRVCKPGQRVYVVDSVSSDDPEKAALRNRIEKLRDPSHVAFRPAATLSHAVEAAGLEPIGVLSFDVPIELESQLARSFPEPGDADRVRKALWDALPTDATAMNLRQVGKALHFVYPSIALLARKPGTPPRSH